MDLFAKALFSKYLTAKVFILNKNAPEAGAFSLSSSIAVWVKLLCHVDLVCLYGDTGFGGLTGLLRSEKRKSKSEMRGSLHCVMDDKAVHRFGRDDEVLLN